MFEPSSIGFRRSTLGRSLAAILAGSALALAILPGIPAWAASNQAHVDRQVLKAMQQGQRLPVILVAHGEINALEADLRRSGVKHTVRVPIAHGIATELTASLLARFSTRSDVERIIYDAPVQLTDTAFDASALATAYPAVVDAVAAWSGGLAPLTGKSVGVAVIDSGISAHPDLGGRVIISRSFNPTVTGTDAAVEYAWLKGIVVVVAAGNTGPNSALYAPANDPYVITVGATDDHGTAPIVDDTLAGFSAYGVTQDGFSKPDFVAPGRRIITT